MRNHLAGVVSVFSTTKTISTLIVARIPAKFVGSLFLIVATLASQSIFTLPNKDQAFAESTIHSLPILHARVGPLKTEVAKAKESVDGGRLTFKASISASNTYANSFSSPPDALPQKPKILKTNSETFRYTKKLRVFATSYDSNCPGCSDTTALGLKAGYGVIAVDPGVIPLGSKVYVPGYGIAIAGDTGGAIKGNVVDLGFDNIQSGWWSSR